ncbi:hypothetical protein GCM10010172_52020 [Paractinoplanes ferrugineus]|uniref:Uncharacterized protein n=1 Tax=Paractinoplanes ferrugineus TaxID=113564 RepID=A0A919J3S3_9ACTN|nr:hypothetical protein Afe05nite_38190 [Actinoplanes ferrugineus]
MLVPNIAVSVVVTGVSGASERLVVVAVTDGYHTAVTQPGQSPLSPRLTSSHEPVFRTLKTTHRTPLRLA